MRQFMMTVMALAATDARQSLGAGILSQGDRPVISRRKAATWSNAKRAIATC
jgi:hypothetical protein